MSRKLESCFSIQQDLGTTIPVPSLATWVEIWKKTMLSQQKVSPPGPWRAWPFRNLCSLPPHSSSSDDRIVSEWGEDFFLPLSGWKEESGAIIGWKKRGNFSHGRVVMSESGVKVRLRKWEKDGQRKTRSKFKTKRRPASGIAITMVKIMRDWWSSPVPWHGPSWESQHFFDSLLCSTFPGCPANKINGTPQAIEKCCSSCNISLG